MIELRVEHNLPELSERLVLAKNAIGNWGQFFDALHILWIESRERMFRTQGASTDTPWPDYSAVTKERQYAVVKAKIFGRRLNRADILRWIGGQERLYPSMVDDIHPEHIYEKTTDTARMGTAVPYARNHEMGQGKMPAWAGGHRVPMRRLMALGLSFKSEIAALVSAHAGMGVIANLSPDAPRKQRAGMTTEEYLQMARGA